MFDRILRFSVFRPLPSILLALALIAGAFFSYKYLPIDAVPDITNVQVQVITRADSLDGETIEANVTYPIESAMGAVPDVQEVRSVTRYGLSVVTVIFEEGMDIYLARQLINEQLATLDLQGFQPRLGPIATGLGEIYHYSLDFKEPARDPQKRLEQLNRLRTIQEWDIKRRLLSLPGVAEVNTIGGYEEVYFVQPDPRKMERYGVHFDDIRRALQESNRNAGGGYIQQSANQLIVQGSGLIHSTEEIESLTLKQLPDLTSIAIGDVASVGLDREIRTGAGVINGEEAVLGTVFMLLGENSRTVASRVDSRIQQIREDLPEDVVLKTVYNRSYLVDGTIATVRENLMFGALLVVAVLLFLTGNIRAALIASAVIPLAMSATLISMYFTGVSANLMSLGALDFGIIIDGAVIVIDQCVHRVRQRSDAQGRLLSREEIREAVASASVEIRRAAGFGQIIILVVFLPIFALTGIEGKMFRPMAAAFCFALFAAFVLAFTVVPALAGIFLSSRRSRFDGLSGIMDSVYSVLLSRALQRRGLVLGVAGLLLLLGVLAFRGLGGEFIPQLYERAVAMQFVRPPSISLDASVKLERLSHRVIMEFPEVADVYTRVGAPEIATDPMGVNLADCNIMLKPRDQWPEVNGRVRTPDELRMALKQAVQSRIPGQRILMSQPIELRFNELLEGSRADLVLKIYGDDLEVLQSLSEKAAGILSGIPGAGSAEPETRGQIPIIRVEPKLAMLNSLGLSRKEVLDTLEMGMGGLDTGHLYRGARRFPIRIRLSEEDRSLESLRTLPVGVTESDTEPLGKLARIYESKTFEMIKRDSMQRRGAILLNPETDDISGLVERADLALRESLELPEGYYMEWGGSFKNLQAARSRLSVVAPVAFLVVALMIYSAFRDWLRTLLVLTGVPFALVGGVLALFLSGQSLSISASVGFIALFGISVLNGVVLMSRYRDLSDTGMTGVDLATTGARSRLRAVTMTALTDIFGFMPMMLATGLGAEVQRPLATVVVGGVLSSSFVILFFFPVVHSMLEPFFKTEKGP
tara:strand:+ start:12294 stop:15416 length:3123 start_codon:yes stop_codon:yes gene_type:complete